MELFSHKDAETTEERRDDALRTIRAGVDLIHDVMRTTLGPAGALKILQGKEPAVSNDGAFILKNLLVDSPAAQIIASSSIHQDLEEGDGTTSIAVLTSLLLAEAYRSSVPPIKLIRGFSLALTRCLDTLTRRRFAPSAEDIRSLVRTTLNSKVLAERLELFTGICIAAAQAVDDLDCVEIIKLEGDLGESALLPGFVLDRAETVELTAPRILVANTALDFDKIKIMSSRAQVRSVEELVDIEREECARMAQKIDEICATPFDLFINRQLIYDYPLQLLRNRGVTVIEHADFAGVERLNRVLGGRILSSFQRVEEADFGTCARVTNITLRGRRLVQFEGVKRGAATIVLYGSSPEMREEAARAVHDALCVIKRVREQPFCVYGGGCTEMALALELGRLAAEMKTKEAEGVECFARALQQIPKILADNAGFDGDEARAALRSDHTYRRATHGINVETGRPGCMKERGIVEGYEMKRRVLIAACETAQSILKCDGLVSCKPKERHSH